MKVSRKSQLYQVIDVKSTEVTYPYCPNCYKKVYYLSFRKKWSCSSCNEKYDRVDYRYKLSIEIAKMNVCQCVTAFGKNLELLFGVSSNEFVVFKRSFVQADLWLQSLENAFRQCLIGRWLWIDMASGSGSVAGGASSEKQQQQQQQQRSVIKLIEIPGGELDNSITIYHFMRTVSDSIAALNFSSESESSVSIVDATVNEPENDEEQSVAQPLTKEHRVTSRGAEQFSICSLLTRLELSKQKPVAQSAKPDNNCF